MASIPPLAGIRSELIDTSRLRQHVLFSGSDDAIPVLFLHGNVSSSTFWEEAMLALPASYRGIAPDLRGYGDTEDLLIDARRGMSDWVEDLLALKEILGLESYHVVGHSLGGVLLYSLMVSDAANILSTTLVAPGSPFGFGGSKDAKGAATYADFAGSGGGTVNPDFARLISEGDRSSEHQVSPRVVMNAFYWKPPFVPAREEALLSSMLAIKTGPERYPGDMTASENWPGVGPGIYGPNNALSPKYLGSTVEDLLTLEQKPPVLWLRGADDQIVSDLSLFDFGTLGQMGAVPDWPGAEVHPPQPMIQQIRFILGQYELMGGFYREVVLENCGHTAFIEQPEVFMQRLLEHLSAATS